MRYAIAVAAAIAAQPSLATDELVHGYFRADGTYVAPYLRTPANGLQIDNYSGPGRIPMTVPRLEYPTPQPLRPDQIAPSLAQPPVPSYRFVPGAPVLPFVLPMDDDDDDD